jgi:hypothetical protein
VAADHPEDPYVHQVLAGLLGCARSTWPDAWEHYKLALRDGPLLSTTYKAAAYYLGRRLEPALASLPLQGSSGVESLVIRTRAFSVRVIFLVFFALAVIGALVGSKQLALGLLLSSIATVWALWYAAANFYIGCWKCFLVWISSAFATWILFVGVHANPVMGFFIGCGGLIGGLIGANKSRRTQTSERQLTR